MLVIERSHQLALAVTHRACLQPHWVYLLPGEIGVVRALGAHAPHCLRLLRNLSMSRGIRAHYGLLKRLQPLVVSGLFFRGHCLAPGYLPAHAALAVSVIFEITSEAI